MTSSCTGGPAWCLGRRRCVGICIEYFNIYDSTCKTILIADTLVQTVFDSQLYTLSIFCDDNYPDRPPTFQFNYKINLNFVDAKGFV